ETAELAVAEVIGQRHRGVADLSREQLDQECGDRAIDHRYVDHLDENEQDQQDDIGARRLHHGQNFTGRIGGGAVLRERPGRRVHRYIDRDVGDGGDQTASHHNLFPADPIRERAEEEEEGCSYHQRNGDDDIGGDVVDLEDSL